MSKFTNPAEPSGPEAEDRFSVMGHGLETQAVNNRQEALGSVLSRTSSPLRKGKASYSKRQMQGWPWRDP